MSYYSPTIPLPTYTTQENILMLLGIVLIIVWGWATIEIMFGILQLLFAPKQSTVKTNAPKRIKIGCLTLFIAVLIFFLLGSFFPTPYS